MVLLGIIVMVRTTVTLYLEKKQFPLGLQTFFDEVKVANPLGSKTKIHEVAKLLRNKVNYEEAVITSSGIDGLSQRKESGVEKGYILNKLKYFHITENVTTDAMHDILEGLIPFTLKIVMNHWTLNPPPEKEKKFQPSCLIVELRNFLIVITIAKINSQQNLNNHPYEK